VNCEYSFHCDELANVSIPIENISQIHTPFSFDDFPSRINLEIRCGDELKKHQFIHKGVTQWIVD